MLCRQPKDLAPLFRSSCSVYASQGHYEQRSHGQCQSCSIDAWLLQGKHLLPKLKESLSIYPVDVCPWRLLAERPCSRHLR